MARVREVLFYRTPVEQRKMCSKHPRLLKEKHPRRPRQSTSPSPVPSIAIPAASLLTGLRRPVAVDRPRCRSPVPTSGSIVAAFGLPSPLLDPSYAARSSTPPSLSLDPPSAAPDPVAVEAAAVPHSLPPPPPPAGEPNPNAAKPWKVRLRNRRGVEAREAREMAASARPGEGRPALPPLLSHLIRQELTAIGQSFTHLMGHQSNRKSFPVTLYVITIYGLLTSARTRERKMRKSCRGRGNHGAFCR